jgi:hypothetical protein
MTEKTTEKKLDFKKYAFADVAAQMSQSEENKLYASGAFNLLRKNLDFGIDGADLYDGFITEGMTDKLLEIYGGKHNKALAQANVGELIAWYDTNDAMKGASNSEKAAINAVLKDFKGMNYGELTKKMADLDYKTKNPTNQKAAESAKKEFEEKYGAFVMVQQALQGYAYKALELQAVDASRPNTMKGLEKIAIESGKYKPSQEAKK